MGVASLAPQWAAGVCAGVHASGSRDVVYVPDNPLSHVLRIFQTEWPDVRLVLATREEEAFGIAAGLYLGGRKAAQLGCHPLKLNTVRQSAVRQSAMRQSAARPSADR